jgi:hypothetical protein
LKKKKKKLLVVDAIVESKPVVADQFSTIEEEKLILHLRARVVAPPAQVRGARSLDGEELMGAANHLVTAFVSDGLVPEHQAILVGLPRKEPITVGLELTLHMCVMGDMCGYEKGCKEERKTAPPLLPLTRLHTRIVRYQIEGLVGGHLRCLQDARHVATDKLCRIP